MGAAWTTATVTALLILTYSSVILPAFELPAMCGKYVVCAWNCSSHHRPPSHGACSHWAGCASLPAGFRRACGQTAYVPGNFLAKHIAQHLFRHRLLCPGKVSSKRLVHHGLVADPGLLCARAKFVEHGVVDKDRNARLALLGNHGAALSLRKIIFSFHTVFAPFASHDAPR